MNNIIYKKIDMSQIENFIWLTEHVPQDMLQILVVFNLY